MPRTVRKALSAHDAPDEVCGRWIVQAREQGWRVNLVANGHIRFLPRDRSVPPVQVSFSPSDHRSRLNERSRLRRAGLEV